MWRNTQTIENGVQHCSAPGVEELQERDLDYCAIACALIECEIPNFFCNRFVKRHREARMLRSLGAASRLHYRQRRLR
jgi:hypothetical protein